MKAQACSSPVPRTCAVIGIVSLTTLATTHMHVLLQPQGAGHVRVEELSFVCSAPLDQRPCCVCARMVPDVFQIIVKEKGVFTNVTSPSTKAKLRILFEVAPLALLVRHTAGET